MIRKHTLRLVAVSGTDSSSQMASLSTRVLAQQNRIYRDTGGVSDGCRDGGFRPAFLDRSTGITWLSQFADGRVAPLHGCFIACRHVLSTRRPVKTKGEYNNGKD